MGKPGNSGADGLHNAVIRVFFEGGYGERQCRFRFSRAYYIKGRGVRPREYAFRLYDL